MTKRWISEEHLKSLPPAMTRRALAVAPALAQQPRKAPRKAAATVQVPTPPAAPEKPAQTSTQRMQALGRLPAGVMNKTEEAYAAHLEQLRHEGKVLWFKFEGIKLRLAGSTFYTVDFFVMPASRELEAHEVKGFWTDDARVKIKVAAGMYPVFKFIAIKKQSKADGGGWNVESF